ncbi:ABC transporter substrate-binding protein [Propionivibrio sp.]|uniref:ABC transporter substrate-binding protein n=1 Tax=Propionivibrio sp. TaxID=2212460 RepID=UPI00272E9940|nr:ABC transporter substrate-binding protein [Propionivibrio sp.]
MNYLSARGSVASHSGMRYFRCVLFAFFCALPVWAQDGSPVRPLDVVDLQLRWKHQFQFAGYYAAVEKGFYREAGLDVRLHEGAPGKAPVDEVLAGRAAYGTANSELLFARLQGHPLVALAVIFQHSPSVLLARADSGVRTPHDLVGKKVMFMGGKHDTDFLAMFLREGVRPEKIEIIPSSYDIMDLVSGRVDAFNSYLTNEPFFLKQLGVDYVVINPSHYGIDYYGDVLFTTENEIRKNPDRVKALREATLRGWRYAMNHPDEIIDILLEKYVVPKTREHLQFEATASRSLILPDLVEIGHMNPGRWQGMVDALVSAGMASYGASLEGFLYDPGSHSWRARLHQTMWGMGSVIALILVGVGFMFNTLRRLRREIAKRRSIEAQLLNANDLLKRTGRLAKVGGFERNVVNNTTILSEEAARIRELPAGVEIPFDETMRYYPPEERPQRRAENERAMRSGESWEHESLVTMPSGKNAWIYVRGEAVFRDGQVVKLIGAMQDITDRKQAELALIRRTRELEMHNSILRQIHQGVALSEVLNSLASQAELLHPGMLCSILLLDTVSNHLRHVAAPSLPGQFVRDIDRMLANDESCSSGQAAASGRRVIVANLREGSACSAAYCRHAASAGFQSCWSQPITGRERRVLGVFAIYQRVSAQPGDDDIQLLENCANLAALVIEHYQADEKIRNLAYFDALTRLPNRRMLVDRLRQAMANSRRSGCYGALMFLDLDNFKPLNDAHGHYVGDLLLVQVAERITSCVRETDTVARFGGDEFVVMLGELDESHAASEIQARGVAEKIRCILSEPFTLRIKREGEPEKVVVHCCTASIGVVLFYNHEASMDDIIKWADEAMYQAKESGRNGIRLQSSQHPERGQLKA